MLPFLTNLPPGAADVALERVRQLLVASDEILGVLADSGGAEAIETVYWFNPLDNRNGPICQVGLNPAGPDVDGPLGFSQQDMAVLVRLRFRYTGNWSPAHRGAAIPLVFASVEGVEPVNPVPVPRTLASWSAAVIRALRVDQKLSVIRDGVEQQLAESVVYGPHAFGVEPVTEGAEFQWYNADTAVTYKLMTDFRTGSLWNLRG